jgi:collagen triple helix repeat protein
MPSSVRNRLTYANVVATLALFFAMSGGALAATHYLVNSTKQINPKVLKRLKGNRGTTGARGAIGLAGTPGLPGETGKEGKPGLEGKPGPTLGNAALAGVGVSSTGAVSDWFNAYGGEPTISNPSTGTYDVKFPAAPIEAEHAMSLVTPGTPSSACTAVEAAYSGNGSETEIVVEIKECGGAFVDRAFSLLVFGDHTLG